MNRSARLTRSAGRTRARARRSCAGRGRVRRRSGHDHRSDNESHILSNRNYQFFRKNQVHSGVREPTLTLASIDNLAVLLELIAARDYSSLHSDLTLTGRMCFTSRKNRIQC